MLQGLVTEFRKWANQLRLEVNLGGHMHSVYIVPEKCSFIPLVEDTRYPLNTQNM